MSTSEERRLRAASERRENWKRWGPYLSERAWGTVREDYSRDGNAWNDLPHDHARSKVYRWNEDGLAGICDRRQKVCLALSLWNEHDPILKERLFGLTSSEGNHGEDVKEYYFYLDSTPTHSYMKYLYKYPQRAFPYAELVEKNCCVDRRHPEIELLDTGIFEGNRYFDVFVEYAKGGVDDILMRITAINRGPETAPLHLLPTIWYRNTWSWNGDTTRPILHAVSPNCIAVPHPDYGERWLYCEGTPELLFTENETNQLRLYNLPNQSTTKDGINDYLVQRSILAVNVQPQGTKAAAHYAMQIPAGGSVSVRLRLTDRGDLKDAVGPEFDAVFVERQKEADEFYATVIPAGESDDARRVMRQAFAGLLWSKQFYHYVVRDWLRGDPALPPPPKERHRGRNAHWTHLHNEDVISMPDKWEYPWYAAWDLAFHCVPLALIDADFAKEQLLLLLREWYMHPNGQLPAYEWTFSDVNPPVHAWAAWRVYKIEEKRCGRGDVSFLERVFHKLLLNFNWWVNRKDADDKNIFQGGFLGLDNIGVFDRSAPLPTGGHIEQSDATSWMAMYALNLLAIARELARHNPSYEDVAGKFWEHFLFIAHAMNHMGDEDIELWHEEDGFYYDVLHLPNNDHYPLRVRSIVGLIPLFAVETLEPEVIDRLPSFKQRMQWFLTHRRDLTANVACMRTPGRGERRLLSVVDRDKLRRILRSVLDEDEFLSPYGIRALSRVHRDRPYMLHVNNADYCVGYEPAESNSNLFGGNSNWRGPVWFPVNYLLIESLQKFHHYLGPDYRVECPTGSGQMMNLWEVATELSRRLSRLFLCGPDGARPVHGKRAEFQKDPHWRDLILFYEYFNGDTGEGLGASHQTGWTALVAKLIQQSGT